MAGVFASASHCIEIDEDGESDVVVEMPLEGVVMPVVVAAAPIAPPG